MEFEHLVDFGGYGWATEHQFESVSDLRLEAPGSCFEESGGEDARLPVDEIRVHHHQGLGGDRGREPHRACPIRVGLIETLEQRMSQ